MTITAQVNLRVPLDLLAWLRERARQEHRSLASMIKAVLEDARAKGQPQRSEGAAEQLRKQGAQTATDVRLNASGP